MYAIKRTCTIKHTYTPAGSWQVCPASHGVQLTAMFILYVPGAQGIGKALGLEQAEPLGHTEQEAAPPNEYWPLKQRVLKRCMHNNTYIIYMYFN